MGLEAGEPKSSKVLFYPPGSTDYVRYEGASYSLDLGWIGVCTLTSRWC